MFAQAVKVMVALPGARIADNYKIKKRKNPQDYYQYYTDEVWGDKRNKALMINTSATGVDGAVELIADYLKMKGYVE